MTGKFDFYLTSKYLILLMITLFSDVWDDYPISYEIMIVKGAESLLLSETINMDERGLILKFLY